MKIVPLSKNHNRDVFDCGNAELNEFLQQRASQYSRQNIGQTYIAVVTEDDDTVLGYCTVATGSVPFDNIPGNLPRHPIPVIHLGRLATDISARGQGIGKALLFYALKAADDIAKQVGAYAVEVVAIDDDAQAFYEKFGFSALLPSSEPGDRVRLYLSIKKIRQLGL